MHRDAGQTDRDFWQDQLDAKYQIIDCATIGRTVFYAAVLATEGDEAGQTHALVVLTRWSGGYYNYGYKAISERYGPCEDQCPARLLDKLTELPECEHFGPQLEYFLCATCSAREWRARCRKVADARARAATVKPGQVIKFARPVKFRSGAELDTLTFAKRDIFTADGMRYRVTGWRTMTGWELAS